MFTINEVRAVCDHVQYVKGCEVKLRFGMRGTPYQTCIANLKAFFAKRGIRASTWYSDERKTGRSVKLRLYVK